MEFSKKGIQWLINIFKSLQHFYPSCKQITKAWKCFEIFIPLLSKCLSSRNNMTKKADEDMKKEKIWYMVTMSAVNCTIEIIVEMPKKVRLA